MDQPTIDATEIIETQEDIGQLIQIRRAKLDALKQAGKDPYLITKFTRTHNSKDIIEGFEALEGQKTSIAGRMISKRIMGKAMFAHILDREGTIQVYIKRDDIGEEEYARFKTNDIGDIIGVEGEIFRTHKGEISVRAETVTLLTKSLQPLPEKFHGLKDPDLRYRQRYVDMIVNPEVKNAFIIRTKIVKIIRQILDERDYLEVETPILHTIPTGAAAKPFVTHHNTLDIPMYMRIETELYLKRLIVGGLERVYEIGRLFRNEGMDTTHNPEFTTIELYEAYCDYTTMMEITERIYQDCAMTIQGATTVTWQGDEINLNAPWRRADMTKLVEEYTGVDFTAIADDDAARQAAKAAGAHQIDNFTHGQVVYAMFEQFVEKNLIQPTFVTGYPVEVSPLAKRIPGNEKFTERFECFIRGVEICNAFSELNDPIDQKERFLEQARTKMAGEGDIQMDDDFINAIEIGLPPTGGMGLSIDRLAMIMADVASIRDVILFPTMRVLK